MRVLPGVLLAAIVGLCAVGRVAGFYEASKDVISIVSEDAFAEIDKSKLLWLVAVYKKTCQFSQKLVPEYERAAAKLKDLVRIAAIDIDLHNALVQRFESKYNFKLTGVPLLFFLKPGPGGKGKRRIEFAGERTYQGIVSEATKQMPDFTQGITMKSFEKFLGQSTSKAVLFTDKLESPPIWRALSGRHINRIAFGLAPAGSPNTKDMLRRLGAGPDVTFPAIFVVRGDKDRVEGEDFAVQYGGSISFKEIDLFLAEYASGKPVPKNKVQGDTRIRIKGKDLTKFSVKELREILLRWQDACDGCVEKFSFIDRITLLRAKFGDRDPLPALKLNNTDSDGGQSKSAVPAFTGDFESCKTELADAAAKIKALERDLLDMRNERDALAARVEDIQAKTTDCRETSGYALATDPGNEEFVIEMVDVAAAENAEGDEDVVYESEDDIKGTRRTEL